MGDRGNHVNFARWDTVLFEKSGHPDAAKPSSTLAHCPYCPIGIKYDPGIGFVGDQHFPQYLNFSRLTAVGGCAFQKRRGIARTHQGRVPLVDRPASLARPAEDQAQAGSGTSQLDKPDMALRHAEAKRQFKLRDAKCCAHLS